MKKKTLYKKHTLPHKTFIIKTDKLKEMDRFV